MPWYKSGTVKTTNNSNAIIGAGTAFIANSRVGDAFRGPDGAWYEVTNIASDTALSISPNYQGPSVAAGGYALAPMQGYVKDLADQARAIIQQWGATLAGLGPLSSVTVAPVSNGGTGATSAAAARTNLGLGTAATAMLTTSAQDQSIGRLLKVGDYGIGGGAPVANEIIDNQWSVLKGLCYATSNTPGTKPTPVGLLDTRSGGNGDAIYQEWYEVTGAPLSLRRFYRGGFGSSNSWGAWYEYYHTGNTTRAADGTLKAI